MLVLVDEDLGITRVSPFTSVQDVGRITNEKTARSQIKGGVVGESARYTETAGWFPIDTFIEAAEVNDYDALVIGGGVESRCFEAKPGRFEVRQKFRRKAENQSVPICHAPWVLVSAGILKGKNVMGSAMTHLSRLEIIAAKLIPGNT